MEVSLWATGSLNHWPLVTEPYFQAFSLPGSWVGPGSSNPSHRSVPLATALIFKAVSVGAARSASAQTQVWVKVSYYEQQKTLLSLGIFKGFRELHARNQRYRSNTFCIIPHFINVGKCVL